MTRINVGIHARELCDAHLIAEYRELPRLWAFEPKSTAPPYFCLGKGHVLWCAQYPRLLADRFAGLVNEMQTRGFKPLYLTAPQVAQSATRLPDVRQIADARKIVIARIRDRLSTMKRVPKWTRRSPPNWTR